MTATIIPFRKAEGPQTLLECEVEVVQKHARASLGRGLSPELARKIAERLNELAQSRK